MQWRKIESLASSHVQVSDEGYVKYTTKRGKEVLTVGSPNTCGYLTVTIAGKQYMVSRLVAHAFLDATLPLRPSEAKDDKREVDHGVFGRTCNRLDNLRIVKDRKANCSLPWSIARYKKRYEGRGNSWKRFGTLCYVAHKDDTSTEFYSFDEIATFLFGENFTADQRNSVRAAVAKVAREGKGTYKGYRWTKVMDKAYKHKKGWKRQQKYHHEWYVRQKQKNKEQQQD